MLSLNISLGVMRTLTRPGNEMYYFHNIGERRDYSQGNDVNLSLWY